MKKKYLLVYMSMLLISCGFFQETYTSEDAAGVRIVHNNRSSWGDGEKISLEYVRKIGLLSGEDENYIFSEPVDAAGDSEGNIYILDKGKHRVQKFDLSGRYLLTIGRQGTEDGEFIKPDMIEITGSDEVYVCKFLRNVQRFSSTGEFLSDFESPVNEREFKVLSDGSIIIRNVIQGSDQFLLSKISREYALMNKFGEAVTDEDVKKTVNQNLLYFDTDSKDNVYAVFRHQNRIDKYSTDGD
ncbi:MAG: hypothetical protein GY863_12705, partial [bacterium]|nr:hypothetical protein [bacterium]